MMVLMTQRNYVIYHRRLSQTKTPTPFRPSTGQAPLTYRVSWLSPVGSRLSGAIADYQLGFDVSNLILGLNFASRVGRSGSDSDRERSGLRARSSFAAQDEV